MKCIEQKWLAQPCIVAATGPSLDEVAAGLCYLLQCKGYKIAAVNDAYRKIPTADLLYASDRAWWLLHNGCPDFHGEKWISNYGNLHYGRDDVANKFGLHVVKGHNDKCFSFDPRFINHGCNSGFSAINLVLLLGANPIVLVGFNMQEVNGKRHFFGDHPKGLHNAGNYRVWLPVFASAARQLPKDRIIYNATPDSALDCFERKSLGAFL